MILGAPGGPKTEAAARDREPSGDQGELGFGTKRLKIQLFFCVFRRNADFEGRWWEDVGG